MRRPTRSAARLFVAATALVAVGGAVTGESTVVDQGELFTSPVRGETWRALRDDASGRKWFEGPDGRHADSTDAICLAEEADLSPLEKVVERGLLAEAQDPRRAVETADVMMIFARQPAHDAGVAARAHYAPLFEAPLTRSRAIVSRLASRRADPEHVDPLEDEALLTGDEKRELSAAQEEVKALSAEMRKGVCELASADAAADQADVRAWLEARGDVRVFGSSWILSTVSARVPLGVVTELATRFPEIGRVVRMGRREPMLSISVPTVTAGTWWSAGYSGGGSTVAIIDTGVDGTHPALTVSSSAIYLAAGSAQSNFADSTSTYDDNYGHGTHLAGIVASADTTNKGVASGTSLMAVKTGYLTNIGGGAYMLSDIFAGSDWAGTHGATAFNCSFGVTGVTTNGMQPDSLFYDAAAFDLAVDIAIAAGNAGPSGGTMSVPADGFNVMAVGNFDDNGTTTWSDDVLYSTSGRGATSDGRRKPDISAPGTNIYSTNAFWESTNPDFIAGTGTSMSTPHVAGAMAILRGYATSWTPEGIKALLLTTARNTSPAPTSPDNNWGYGGLDLGAAYGARASVYEGTIGSGAYRLVSLASIAASKRVTLVWNRHVRTNSASTPTTYYSLADLDLYLYNGATGALLGSSASTVNSVEQYKTTAAVTTPIVKIRAGTFPTGVSTESFAIASETTGSATSYAPPALVCSFTTTAPAMSYLNVDYPLVVDVTNTGALSAPTPVVTLSPPSGWTAVGGATRTLATLGAGAVGTASFTVRATAGPPGTKQFFVGASTTAFGEPISSASVATTTTLDNVPPTGSIVVAAGATYATAADVALTLAASDPSGVPTMRLRDAGGAWGSWEAFATSKAWTLPAQGACTVEVEFQDVLGNSAQFSDSITFDSVGPTGSLSLGVGAYTTAATADLALSATDAVSGVVDQRVGDGSTFGAWEAYGTAHVVSLGTSGTVTTRTAQFRDAAGNVSPTYSDATMRDTVAPTGSIVIGDGSTYTNEPHTVLSLSATDDASGVAQMRLSFNGGATWTGWSAYSSSVGASLPTPDALNTIQAQYRDRAGNVSPVYSTSIFVDATGPTGSLSIDGGARYTAGTTVALALTASDASSGVGGMRLRDEGGSWGAWGAFAASVQWTLPSGEGSRTVLVQFRDATGNLSDEIAATIVRDVSPPSGTVAILGGPAVNHADVPLALASSDAASGVVEMRLSTDGAAWGAWTAVADAADFALSPGEGVRRAWAQWKDAVGNVSAAASAEILVDLTAPTGTLALDGGAALLFPWDVLSAEPTADDGAGGSGVATVEYSEDDGATWTAPGDPSVAATLPAPTSVAEGTFAVLARWRDVAGNVSLPATASAYRVAAAAQALDAAKALTGTIAAGGDVDSYTLELLAGDALTVKQTVRSAKKGGKFDVALDVYDPSNALVVDGRFPVGAKKSGIVKFAAPVSGTYVVVVRALGADAALGGTYTLLASAKAGKKQALKGVAKLTTPVDGELRAVVKFSAAQGGFLTGTARFVASSPIELVAPDGSVFSTIVRPTRGLGKLGLLALDGGTGEYQLRFVGETSYALKLVPLKKVSKAVETPPAGQR